MTPLEQARQIIATQFWITPPCGTDLDVLAADIAHAIFQAVADEREACAAIADLMEESGHPGSHPGLVKYSPIAAKIRERGKA